MCFGKGKLKIKKMKDYLGKLLNVALFGLVFLGLPLLVGGWTNLWWSWFPAIVLVNYLDNG